MFVKLSTMLFVILVSLNGPLADAKSTYVPDPFEKGYVHYGYRSINQAVKECEEHFNRNNTLPIKLPQVTFTHQLARCSKESGFNSMLEIEYINEFEGSNHYQIWVRPVENRSSEIPFKDDIRRSFILKDGTKAIYGTTPKRPGKQPIANVLVFEHGYWQYVLSLDSRSAVKEPAEVLVDIAESVILSNDTTS